MGFYQPHRYITSSQYKRRLNKKAKKLRKIFGASLKDCLVVAKNNDV